MVYISMDEEAARSFWERRHGASERECTLAVACCLDLKGEERRELGESVEI